MACPIKERKIHDIPLHFFIRLDQGKEPIWILNDDFLLQKGATDKCLNSPIIFFDDKSFPHGNEIDHINAPDDTLSMRDIVIGIGFQGII